jgi:putative SOS response-associated peptidase YedK
MVRWGLIPFYMKEKPRQPHINARAETVDRTPLFREAFANRRCLIPATGFFEWAKAGKVKQPYRLVLRSRQPFAFAGIWESAKIGGERIHSAAIIVTDANAVVARLHDRMPVILSPDDYGRWLDAETPREVARSLLRPFPPELMDAYPVSTIVNSYENDSEECIAPITLEWPTQPDLLPPVANRRARR